MKSFQIILTLIIGVSIGSIVTFFFTKSDIPNPSVDEIVDAAVVMNHHAEILKGTLVAQDKNNQVIILIKGLIENGICTDEDLQSMYSNPEI